MTPAPPPSHLVARTGFLAGLAIAWCVFIAMHAIYPEMACCRIVRVLPAANDDPYGNTSVTAVHPRKVTRRVSP